ncbi:PadR family transcriptional regulator [Micropruina sp.]|uniref:PadR family transcriptional regulator n=1 Tax=Micropruina sp. TaxID=2737536 RepID=UPI0039E6B8B0
MRNDEFNQNGPRQRRGHQGRPQRGPFGQGPARGGFGFGGPGFGPGFGGPGPGFGGPMGRRGRGRARRGDVRQAVLALLADEPLNGYQMIQRLAEHTEGGWKPSPGAIYPALAQLEDEGLIEQFDNEGTKAYRLTEVGRSAAAEIGQKPWETFNAENAPLHPEAMKALWGEFRGLAMAAQELTRNGSPAQQERAGQLLAETKRKLYGLLAEGEMHNGDDLR